MDEIVRSNKAKINKSMQQEERMLMVINDYESKELHKEQSLHFMKIKIETISLMLKDQNEVISNLEEKLELS